jgi:hypothetical protein
MDYGPQLITKLSGHANSVLGYGEWLTLLLCCLHSPVQDRQGTYSVISWCIQVMFVSPQPIITA